MQEVSGQVTIIAALTITLIVSFMAAAIKSAGISASRVHVEQACGLAAESVFSGYSNMILDEFDILLLKRSDMINQKLYDYLLDNLKYNKEVELVDVRFDQIEMITDCGGTYLREEILAYMKYGMMSDAVQQLMESEELVKKSEAVNKITEQIVECEEIAYELDCKLLQLIELVEGIETSEAGIVTEQNKPKAVPEYFVKAAVMGEITMTSTVVNNKLVYQAVNHMDTRYCNIHEILEDMMLCTEELYSIGDEESEKSGVNSYGAIFMRDYKRLENVILGCLEKNKEALQVIEQYNASKDKVTGLISITQQEVEKQRQILGEELYEGIMTDLNEMNGNENDSTGTLCDIESMEAALQKRMYVLTQAASQMNKFQASLKQENCLTAKDAIQECGYILMELTNEKLQFDYSGIDFESTATGLGVIRRIYRTLTDGVLELVLESKSCSDKKIDVKNLASKLSGEYKGDQNLVYEAADTALFDTYILDRFQVYTDLLNEQGEYNDNRKGTDLLEYSVEYILCGEDSDQKNLKETIMRLSVLREGMNLAYLLTDAQKKAEALSYASALLGFTGNMAIIKGGQYLILTVWAYGEAIMELRELYKGNKVEFVKKKSNWRLTFENLLGCRLETNEPNQSDGLDYRGYLRLLLFIENVVEKNYQTMGAMELRLIGKGYTDFRMKDYIYAASGQAVFTLKGISGFYTRTIQYSYA